MNHKRLYLSLFFAIAIIIASCGDKKSAQQQVGPTPATQVTVSEVKSTNVSYFDEYPGTLSALNEIRITSQVSGYVTAIFFKDGQKVNKGQRLYSIDAEVYRANYQQAEANLQVQEANLSKAQKDADRYHELDKHDAIAKQQVDYADAALEVAKKQVAAAEANVAGVRSNVNFASIQSPLMGTIGISQVKNGTAVVAGQTILNTVSTDNPVAADFAVNQKEVYRFVQMEQKGINPADSIFTISFGDDVYPYPGKIGLIDRAVDPQTGTIKVRLVFPNDKSMLKSGMNTTIRIKNNASEQATTIPYKAVTEQLGEFFVYVVGDNSKVTQRVVQLGKQIGENIIVKEGLHEGEKIAVEGVQNLHEGSVIATTPLKPAAQQPK